MHGAASLSSPSDCPAVTHWMCVTLCGVVCGVGHRGAGRLGVCGQPARYGCVSMAPAAHLLGVHVLLPRQPPMLDGLVVEVHGARARARDDGHPVPAPHPRHRAGRDAAGAHLGLRRAAGRGAAGRGELADDGLHGAVVHHARPVLRHHRHPRAAHPAHRSINTAPLHPRLTMRCALPVPTARSAWRTTWARGGQRPRARRRSSASGAPWPSASSPVPPSWCCATTSAACSATTWRCTGSPARSACCWAPSSSSSPPSTPPLRCSTRRLGR